MIIDIQREELRRQTWWKCAVKVTESKCSKLVLNAVFYWEPMDLKNKIM